MTAMPQAAPVSNTPELTVSELSAALKRTVEDRFGYVRVRGEISNYRGPHSSGHAYFCLKDQGARLDAVVWKTTLQRLKTKPEEGLEIIATGRVTTFPGKSSYQIVIDSIEPAGIGALMALLDERRRRLAAEGLFDEVRKRPIPYLPNVIGVVTSPTGAVIRDIVHRIRDRFPRRVIVWPVRVQGETSAAEVSAAIRGFNALEAGFPRPDVLIVARGGGSLEDLLGFSEELVVRAVAEGVIPLISAIGHETDTTLIDFAADLRAPTPTGAAEKCVPVRAELLQSVNNVGARLAAASHRKVERRRSDLRALSRALPSAENVLAVPRQRLDAAGQRLTSRVSASLNERRLRISNAAHLLARHSPQAEFAAARGRLDGAGKRLVGAYAATLRFAAQRNANDRARLASLTQRLGARTQSALDVNRERAVTLQTRMLRAQKTCDERRRDKLVSLAQLLGTLGYRSVLTRGFALVRDVNGRPLRRVSELEPGDRMSLQFADGYMPAVAGEAPGRLRPAPRRIARQPAASQDSLF
ncbi:MAG: exodeoxyribonuclease large subunit [Methylobacteriaceae bacterium]|nr:exodeoxyribonuclease large subunit [Methylobacteriaceae bacterium]